MSVASEVPETYGETDGDDARIWGPPFGPDGVTSLYFYGQNRNKRSVTIDIAQSAGQALIHRLAEQARQRPPLTWALIVLWAVLNQAAVSAGLTQIGGLDLLAGFVGISAIISLSSLIADVPWLRCSSAMPSSADAFCTCSQTSRVRTSRARRAPAAARSRSRA